jgi:hypothetical protein
VQRPLAGALGFDRGVPGRESAGDEAGHSRSAFCLENCILILYACLGCRGAVARCKVAIAPEVNRTRLVGTFVAEMAHPEGARIGIGDMDDGRFGRLIDLVVEAKKLPCKPSVHEAFDRTFLLPDAERIRMLARAK